MKKRIILLAIIAFIVLVGIFTLSYVTSHHTITFILKGGTYKVKIFTADNKQLTELSSPSGKAWLQKGEYRYAVSDTKYDTSAHSFSIDDKDKTITIDPAYSAQYLSELLTDSERLKINALLTPYLSKINTPALASIDRIQLYSHGEWAAGMLSYQASRRDTVEYYRFVLHKDDNVWKLVVPPQIAIYGASYPSVPVSIIDNLYAKN